MAETEEQIKARKERERDELYALDISGVEWQSAPGTEEHEERVEIAYLPGGAVAMRSSLDPDTVLRYTEAEWRALVLGARGGGVDPGPAPHNRGGGGGGGSAGAGGGGGGGGGGAPPPYGRMSSGAPLGVRPVCSSMRGLCTSLLRRL